MRSTNDLKDIAICLNVKKKKLLGVTLIYDELLGAFICNQKIHKPRTLHACLMTSAHAERAAECAP